MNADQIKARIAEYEAMEKVANHNIATEQANLSAINGAKQDCQFWLAKLSEETVVVNAPQLVKKETRGRKKKVA